MPHEDSVRRHSGTFPEQVPIEHGVVMPAWSIDITSQ
jgi:hypothetical protein